jgi:hypothetical protein
VLAANPQAMESTLRQRIYGFGARLRISERHKALICVYPHRVADRISATVSRGLATFARVPYMDPRVLLEWEELLDDAEMRAPPDRRTRARWPDA